MAKKDSKLGQLYVGLKLAKDLRKEIFDFLQYGVVNEVMDISGFWESTVSDTVQDIFKYSVKVSDEMMKPLYDMLNLAKKRLDFKEPIDLYVVNDDTINASATLSFDADVSHLIQLNSGMINCLNDEEILSVIGHEIGHLMGRDGEIDRLVDFIYGRKDDDDVPYYLRAKLQMLSQLNEIRCDRCACIASGRIEPNVTSQFTLMCGVKYNRFGGNVQGILSRCSSNIDMMRKGHVRIENSSHPEDPIRIRAMEIFCNNNDTKQMEKEMEEIVDLLQLWDNNEMDKHYVDFMVSAGLMVALVDGSLKDEEVNTIIENIMEFKMFPVKEYRKIAKKDIEKTFRRSVAAILKNNEFEKDTLMKYILRITVADHNIKKEEMRLVIDWAQNVLEMSMEEFVDCYAEVLRESFHPRYML